MNYKKIYEQFIQNRKLKQDFTNKTHIHHIIPRSYGGRDCKSNLIELTVSDHIFAHALLARIYKGKMIWALQFMLGGYNHCSKSIRLHKQFVFNNIDFKGHNNPMFGKNHTKESIKIMKNKLSDGRRKGSNHSMFGKTGENSPLFGIKQSRSRRLKQSKTALSKGSEHHRAKKVIQYDENNKAIAIYGSVAIASKETGIRYNVICKCCTNKYKTLKGSNIYKNFKWEYVC